VRILVTGATGFIGGHVVSALERNGHSVTALHRRPRTSDASTSRVHWVQTDLFRWPLSVSLLNPVDTVVHCAGRLSGFVAMTDSDPPAGAETFAAMDLAVRLHATRFIHISSLAVCDPPRRGAVLDGQSAISSSPARWNRYAIEKIVEERAVRGAHERGRFGAVILRPGIVFGAGDRHATPRFLKVLARRLSFYVGRGDNVVASVAIEDLAEGVIRAATAPGIEGRSYALAGREPLTQRDLFRLHARGWRCHLPRIGLPFRVALGLSAFAEAGAHGRSGPPTMTRVGAWVIGTSSPTWCEAASADLGWTGSSSVADAIERSMAAHWSATGNAAPAKSASKAAARLETDGRLSPEHSSEEAS